MADMVARCDDCNPTDEFEPQAALPGSPYCADHREARKVLYGADPISVDDAEFLGLDGTGRDGSERFPHTLGKLTPDERRKLLTLLENEFVRDGGDLAMAQQVDALRFLVEEDGWRCPYQPINAPEPCHAVATHRVEWRQPFPRAVGPGRVRFPFGVCDEHAWRYEKGEGFLVTPMAASRA